MTDATSSPSPTTREDEPPDRYAALEFAECTVIYDVENLSGWVESDDVVSLEDVR